jgi:hypothetical protein
MTMIIVLDRPFGIGKSTLAKVLTWSIDACAMLSGDHLVAVNPPSKADSNICTGQSSCWCFIVGASATGTSVIEHVWRTESELADVKQRLGDPEVHCFLLTLPIQENLRPVERRQAARAIDEREVEHRTLAEERRVLQGPGLELATD